jgi:hypothetical protein
MTDQDSTIEARQVILDLVTCRRDQNAPPVPWHTISDASDDNPFLGFAIETTWAQWVDTSFQDLVNDMYARKPGTDPDGVYTLKLPDIAHNKPKDLFKEQLPNPLNMRHFERSSNAVESSPASILDLSKALSSLAGNPVNKDLMRGRDYGKGSRAQVQRTADRHEME